MGLYRARLEWLISTPTDLPMNERATWCADAVGEIMREVLNHNPEEIKDWQFIEQEHTTTTLDPVPTTGKEFVEYTEQMNAK